MQASITILHEVVRQHAQEASSLAAIRSAMLRAPHAQLWSLRRLDERLAAHLDGLAVAGADGKGILEELLDDPVACDMFVVGTCTLGEGSPAQLQSLMQRAVTTPLLGRGLHAAFGWTSPDRLRGAVVELLRSADTFERACAIAACAMHRVDPGVAMRLQEADPVARARVLRAAGELGKREHVSACAHMAADEDAYCRFWAAWSAVLLGDRKSALETLVTFAFDNSSHQSRALQLLLQAVEPAVGHELLMAHTADASHVRLRIRSAGLLGNSRYVDWLIAQMGDPRLARLVGESFSLITGLDISRAPFWQQPPADFESGPTEDSNDDNVQLDEDDDLPWPDQERVHAWWGANRVRFAADERYFMGMRPAREHCIDVLKSGYQRQRIAAAYHLCLLNPGTPLFEWRAPAWRQQRELSQMT